MTTKLRHPQVASLRIIHSKTNFAGRSSSLPKRKSAVQMLQETKAFYVKSETVLDKKQEFKPGKVAKTVYGNAGQNDKSQRYDQRDNELQDKLRLLLDFDPIESSTSMKYGHKSLPDLHISPSYSSGEDSDSSFNVKCDADARSTYSALTQPKLERNAQRNEKSGECRRCLKSMEKNCEFQTRSRLYSSFHATKSREFIGSKSVDIQSSHPRRSSNTSSCNRSRHNSSSKHSQSADSGRQSQGGSIGLRTGRSGLPEYPRWQKTSWSDSGTEDDFSPPGGTDNTETERKRPILRSKSDISYKYCGNKSNPAPSTVFRPLLSTSEKLEIFFDHIGMDPADYKQLASNNSGNTSPVYFSSVSSIDSCVDMAIWTVPEPCKVSECPSIVERNARIIKWLYNCKKFQKTIFK